MTYTSVTGIENVGRTIARSGDVLAVLTGGAITEGTAGRNGIFSAAVGVSAMVFGDVAAAEDGIRLEGTASDVFVGRSGNVTGGKFGVWLGATDGQFSVRNEGSITGYEGGVRLAGQFLDLVNTGTISVPMGVFDLGIAAVTLASTQNGGSYLTNTGTIIADRMGSNHSAIVGGLGADIVTNTGLIIGSIRLGAGNDRYYGQEGFWTGGVIALGAGRNMAYGGRGSETFSLVQDGDWLLDDIVDGGGASIVLIFTTVRRMFASISG